MLKENLSFIGVCALVFAALLGLAYLFERTVCHDLQRRSRSRNISYVAMFSALGGVLMLLEIPLFFAPGFYKMDLSELPVLMSAFYLGPVAGVITELLKVLLKLLLDKNKNNGDGTLFAAGSGDAAAAIDAAVDAVNAEGPELFTMTDTQYDTMRQALKNGVYDAPYSASTLRQLNELNALLGELTDLVETNDISGFVARYQKANDLYASLSGKLPDALKKLYETLVRITELENMKDLCICLKKLSTATRGFGLYTITSDNGKLTLETLTRDGFGDPYNHGLRAFAANDEQGWMVIGTANPFMGTQLWRTTVNTPDPMERFTDLNPFNLSLIHI